MAGRQAGGWADRYLMGRRLEGGGWVVCDIGCVGGLCGVWQGGLDDGQAGRHWVGGVWVAG